ncbi:zinc metalloprotease [Flavobacterium oreochromis]|uniref:Uncharacterized protein n=2 Tax=Flavobacterium TaxID=237 RepID=A0A246G748_9FLAO|nr:hypothetical protein [Flavobacterium oreochromis]OWP74145.1 hypothetical protein BWK62_14930 [Flavobacterium oreochromis]
MKNIKEQKFVLVRVKTNINGSLGTGTFNPSEKINLFNSLYQSLVFPKINGEEILDLTTNDDFKLVGSTGLRGKYIDPSGNVIRTEPTLNQKMRELLRTQTSNSFSNCFFVFCFDELANNTSTMGRVEDIGKKSVVLYRGRDDYTLNHEALHGLGLFHTHKDGSITNQNQKYTFIHAFTDATKATDNIMTYQPDGKTTWQWQWKIIKKSIL